MSGIYETPHEPVDFGFTVVGNPALKLKKAGNVCVLTWPPAPLVLPMVWSVKTWAVLQQGLGSCLLELKLSELGTHPATQYPSCALLPRRTHHDPTDSSSPATTAPAAVALAKSKSIGCSHHHWRGLDPCLLSPSTHASKMGRFTIYAAIV